MTYARRAWIVLWKDAVTERRAKATLNALLFFSLLLLFVFQFTLGAVGHWLQLLAAADVVYLVAGLLTFDALLEG